MHLPVTLHIGIDPGTRWNAVAFSTLRRSQVLFSMFEIGVSVDEPITYEQFAQSIESARRIRDLRELLALLPKAHETALATLEIPSRRQRRHARSIGAAEAARSKRLLTVIQFWVRWLEEHSGGFCVVERINAEVWMKRLLPIDWSDKRERFPELERLVAETAADILGRRVEIGSSHLNDAICLCQYGILTQGARLSS